MSDESTYSDEQIHQEMAAARYQHNAYVRFALEDSGPDSDEYRRAVRSAEGEERFLDLMSDCMALRDARRQDVEVEVPPRRRWWQRLTGDPLTIIRLAEATRKLLELHRSEHDCPSSPETYRTYVVGGKPCETVSLLAQGWSWTEDAK